MSIPGGSKQVKSAVVFCHKLASSEDLLNDLFLRLPTKTLARFKCVCKHWKSFISNPEFAENHFRRNAAAECDSNPTGVYFYNVPTSKQYGVSFAGGYSRLPSLAFLGRRTVLEYASNGLILCWNNDINNYVVCNLTTRQCREFSVPESIAHYRHTSYIAFDPSRSPFYKVVVLAVLGDKCEFHIYSSRTASWKIVRATCDRSYMLYSRPAYCNGKFYWNVGKQLLMRFDVDKEQFSSSEYPKIGDFDKYKCIVYFGECRGKLVMVVSTGTKKNCFKVLEMEGGHTGWVVKAKVDLTKVMVLPDDERAVVMCVLKTGKNEYDLVFGVFGDVVLYSMKTKIFEVLEHKPSLELKSMAVFNSGSVYPFKGSFVQI